MTKARLAARALAEFLRHWLLLVLPPLAIVASVIAAWEIYVELSNINPVTLPAPSRIVEAGLRNREVLFDNGLITLQTTLIGLGVSIVLAVSFALAIDAIAPLRRAIYPLLVASQTLPIVVISPLLVLWFGFGMAPKILVVALYTFFPITVAFASGLAAADREALVLMRTLGARRLQTLRLLQVPQALPYLFTGLRISVTYAMVAALFAEWGGARNGLGIYILQMRNAFRTDMVLSAIFVVAAISLTLFLSVGLIQRLVVRWR